MKAEQRDTAQHSPLPWQYADSLEPHVKSRSGLATVAIMNTSDNQEAKANAKLIVRAVNNVEALAEALRASTYALDSGNMTVRKHCIEANLAALAKYEEGK